MNILALDIALRLGWAHSDGTSGVEDFNYQRRGDSHGMRLVYFRTWLKKILQEHPTALVVYEQAADHKSNAATHVSHSMIGVVEEELSCVGIELTSRSNSTIKAHAKKLGEVKGKMNKPRMEQVAENRWPSVELIDDNHADALLLLDLILKELNLPNVLDV